MLGVNMPDVFSALQIYLGSAYVNDFNLFGRTFRVRRRPTRDFRLDAERRAAAPRAQRERRDGAARLVHDRARHHRALPRAALQSVSGGRTRRRGGARLSRRARRSQIMEKLAAETLPRRLRLRMDDARLPADRAPATPAIFAFVLAVVFVFLVLAAQYESLTLPLAVILIVPMCLLAAIVGVVLRGHGQQHPDAGRLRRADRPGGQERHPDRRVRQAARGPGPRPLRRRGRGGASCACGRS